MTNNKGYEAEYYDGPDFEDFPDSGIDIAEEELAFENSLDARYDEPNALNDKKTYPIVTNSIPF